MSTSFDLEALRIGGRGRLHCASSHPAGGMLLSATGGGCASPYFGRRSRVSVGLGVFSVGGVLGNVGKLHVGELRHIGQGG